MVGRWDLTCSASAGVVSSRLNCWGGWRGGSFRLVVAFLWPATWWPSLNGNRPGIITWNWSLVLAADHAVPVQCLGACPPASANFSLLTRTRSPMSLCTGLHPMQSDFIEPLTLNPWEPYIHDHISLCRIHKIFLSLARLTPLN